MCNTKVEANNILRGVEMRVSRCGNCCYIVCQLLYMITLLFHCNVCVHLLYLIALLLHRVPTTYYTVQTHCSCYIVCQDTIQSKHVCYIFSMLRSFESCRFAIFSDRYIAAMLLSLPDFTMLHLQSQSSNTLLHCCYPAFSCHLWSWVLHFQ